MWEIYRKGTIDELENIPEEQWDFRPGDGARTVRDLAMHIAGSSVGFINELVAADPSFMRLRTPEMQQQIAASLGEANTKEQIVAIVKDTSGFARLRENEELLRTGSMKGMGGEQSRLTGLWFAAAHEMYHRGQLATYARSMGEVPAMTKRFG